MQKIIPWLWFHTNAEEAVNFYTSLFAQTKIEAVAHYGEAGAKASGMPIGTVMSIDFELAGQQFRSSSPAKPKTKSTRCGNSLLTTPQRTSACSLL